MRSVFSYYICTINATRHKRNDMKPLTPAQQRVVYVMKEGVRLRKRKDYGWYEFVDKAAYVSTNVANALVRNGVVIQCDESPTCFYYTLNPEYK